TPVYSPIRGTIRRRPMPLEDSDELVIQCPDNSSAVILAHLSTVHPLSNKVESGQLLGHVETPSNRSLVQFVALHGSAHLHFCFGRRQAGAAGIVGTDGLFFENPLYQCKLGY